jgi:hypothetical protein
MVLQGRFILKYCVQRTGNFYLFVDLGGERESCYQRYVCKFYQSNHELVFCMFYREQHTALYWIVLCLYVVFMVMCNVYLIFNVVFYRDTNWRTLYVLNLFFTYSVTCMFFFFKVIFKEREKF